MEKGFFWFVWLLMFILALTLITIMTAFLQRKIRVRYGFDTLPIFIVLYFFNFIFIYHVFGLNWFCLIVCCLYVLVLIKVFSNFQIVGLTGGMGCGKSTISRFFKDDLKFKVIDCDEVAREVVQIGEPAYKEIIRVFGEGVINSETKELDRKALAKIAFSNDTQRRKLNKLMAKPIALGILKHLYRHFRNRESLVILDAPLLFETGVLPWICYPIITVFISNEDTQLKRICARDNCTKEDANARIKSQKPISFKIANADIRINNDTDIAELKKNVITQLTPFVLS